ncbi:VWA domain-containing protein [Myxococcota bacterium]|nr:VWA domain-containing protein [Myxococcota bacterium]
MTLALVVRDERTGVLTSPSHALSVDRGRATLAEGGAALDRDLVVRWAVASLAPGARLDLARAAEGPAEASGLLTLVPPQVPGPVVPRDLVVLLDTSGSMHGRPLQQAVAVACALVDSLLPQDQLQLVEFSTRPRAWREQPVAATPAARAEAVAWLRALQAGGGTEMRAGIEAALARLRGEAQRQVVLVTDGLIGFEQEIVRAVREGLPRGSRVHTVGIGSSVNRGLLTPVARAGGGIERVIGLDEDAQRAAAELVAATAAPLVVDLELSGSALVEVVHHRPPDLLADRPSRLGLRLRAEGGELVVRGQTAAGPWEQRLSVPATAPGQGSGAVVTLVEALGIQYQVATRRTSWLAVSQARTVDPGKPTRRVRVPQAVPYGASVEGLGLRQASGGVVVACLADMSPPRFRKDWAPSGPAGSRSLGQKLANPRDPSPAREPSRVVADHFGAADAEERAREVAERWHEVRVVLARGDRLVLELEVGAAELIWRRPRLLAVTGRDGRELRAHLDLAASTDGGWIRSGQVLRIVLEGPDLGRDWARIEEVLLDADSEHSLRLHLRLVAG